MQHMNSYLLKNACFVLAEWKKEGIAIDPENAIEQLFEEHVSLYVEGMMEAHMSSGGWEMRRSLPARLRQKEREEEGIAAEALQQRDEGSEGV